MMDEQYREQLERYQFQMGPSRGRLAAVLDILTDALALIGQHGVYCRGSDGTTPAVDIRQAVKQLEDSKGLILETMDDLKTDPPAGGG